MSLLMILSNSYGQTMESTYLKYLKTQDSIKVAKSKTDSIKTKPIKK